jgi:hypothetical protein
MGWGTLSNGALIGAAVAEGFGAFVTTDQNVPFQQNIAKLQIGIVVLSSTSWPRIATQIDRVRAAIDTIEVGAVVRVEIA